MAKRILEKQPHGSQTGKLWHTSEWVKWEVALAVEAVARASGISTSSAKAQILANHVNEYKQEHRKTDLKPSFRGKEVEEKKAKKVKAKKAAKVKKVAKKAKSTKIKDVIEANKKEATATVKAAVKESKMTPEQREKKNKADRDRRAAKKVKKEFAGGLGAIGNETPHTHQRATDVPATQPPAEA